MRNVERRPWPNPSLSKNSIEVDKFSRFDKFEMARTNENSINGIFWIELDRTLYSIKKFFWKKEEVRAVDYSFVLFSSRKKKKIYKLSTKLRIYQIECRKTTLPKIVKSHHVCYAIRFSISISNSFRKNWRTETRRTVSKPRRFNLTRGGVIAITTTFTEKAYRAARLTIW